MNVDCLPVYFQTIKLRKAILSAQRERAEERSDERKKRKKERKKEKKEISLPLPNVTMNKLLIEVSECDYIRKMLNKNHMGKVPSKAAKR